MDVRHALPRGAIVGGDYRIVEVLGQGGFGLTYRAEDVRLHSPVAIKEYFPSDIAHRDEGSRVHAHSSREADVFRWGREKFLDEARTLARFRHTSIVRVARLFEANNTAYMVLDFEAGPSLQQWRTALGRPPTQGELDRIASVLLEAIEQVHAAGILHRDIKPANVIMRNGTDPVLIDFGAARQALGARSKTVHAIVTPGYSPKEQYALDVDRQGPWSDIYALGATLSFLITGKSPSDALSRDLEAAAPMETGSREPYRASFIAAVEMAMQTRAEDRPQSVAEWRPLLLGDAVGAGSSIGRAPERTASDGAGADDKQARAVDFDDIKSLTPTSEPRSGRSVVAMAAALALVLGGAGYYQFVHKPRAAVAGGSVPAGSTPKVAVKEPSAAAPPATLTPGASAPPASASPPSSPPAASATQPAAAPAAPPPAPRPSVQARTTLPGSLTESEIEKLRPGLGTHTWKLHRTIFTGQTLRGFSEQASDFAAELERISGGALKIELPRGADAPVVRDLLREVNSVAGLLGWHTPLSSIGRSSAYSIYAGAIPFGLPPADHVRWLRAEGANLIEKHYWRDGYNLRIIPCGIGQAIGAWSRRDITTPEDLLGLQVRGATFAESALRKLGATLTTFDSNAYREAIANQSLDAVLALTPTARLYLATPPPLTFFHTSDWYQPSYLMQFVIGGDVWSKLAAPEQRLLDEACRRNLDKWAGGFPGVQNEILARIRVNKAVMVRPLPPAVIAALRKASEEVLAEEAQRNPDFKAVLASYNRFRR